MDGAAAFGGRSPLGVAGLGGLTGGDAGTAGGGLLGGGPNGGLLNLLGLELPLSGTAAFGADGLASDALAGALASDAFASGTDAASAFGGVTGAAAAVERQGAAPTEDGGACGAWWIDLTEVVTTGCSAGLSDGVHPGGGVSGCLGSAFAFGSAGLGLGLAFGGPLGDGGV